MQRIKGKDDTKKKKCSTDLMLEFQRNEKLSKK